MSQNRHTNSLHDKVIVITGASSGFGKGAAEQFAEHRGALVLAARRAELLEGVATQCAAAGGRAVAVPTDVGKSDEVERLSRAAVEAFGRIDVWVNNAGVGAIGRFTDIPLDDHVRTVQTNLLGTIYGSYFAMRQFRQQGFGTLINVASALGKIPAPYYSSYTASKYGIVGLDGVLRQELAENGEDQIHVCTVLPMAMDTPFFDHAANYTGHETQPIPPLYDPQKVIDTIVRLATKPEDEVIVGAAGKVTSVLHNLMPRTIEKIMARQTHRQQIEKAPPASPTRGSVRKPSGEGTGVRGGRLNH